MAVKATECFADAAEKITSAFFGVRHSIQNVFSRQKMFPDVAFCLQDAVTWLDTTWRTRGYDVKVFQFRDGIEIGTLVQISNDGPDWKRNLMRTIGGQKLAVNVCLLPRNHDVVVGIGNGHWLDKSFSGIAAWAIFAPLVMFPVLGACWQKKLIDQVENEIIAWMEQNQHLNSINISC